MAEREDELSKKLREREQELGLDGGVLNPQAPEVLRDEERNDRRERTKAILKSGPEDETAAVNPNTGEMEVESEQDDPVAVESKRVSKNTSVMGNALREVLKTEAQELESAIGLWENANQMLRGMTGMAAGGLEGMRASLVDSLSTRAEELGEERERVRNELQNLGPVNEDTPLDPQYFGVLQQVVKDQEESDHLADGGVFTKRMEEVSSSPIFNYSPRTETGQLVQWGITEADAEFQEWGDAAGDKVFEATGDPFLSTVAELAISEVPYYFAFGINPIARMGKGINERRQRGKKRREVEKEPDEHKPEFEDAATITDEGRMTSEEILSRVKTFPTEEMLLNRGFDTPDDIVAAYKGKTQKRPIILEMDDAGELRVADGDLEVYARSKIKNSKRKPLNVKITKASGDDTSFNRKMADKMRGVFDEAEASRRITMKDRIKEAWRLVIEQGFDHAGTQKRQIINDAGDAGREAVREYELTAGATVRGKLKWQAWEDKIYSGLSSHEISKLDEIIFDERVRQIDRIHGVGKVKHPNGTTSIDATEHLKQLRDELGAGEYAKLRARAEEYFKAPKQVLDELYVNGIITKEFRDKLKKHRYEPRRLIEQLDESQKFEVPGQEPITVTDSGIRPLGPGTARSLETDSRALMAEYVVRMENRMARNEALKSLGKVADEGVDYIKKPVVAEWDKKGKAKKITTAQGEAQINTPKGMVRLNYMEDGKQQPVFVDSEMAKVWTNNVLMGDPRTANILRKASGSFLVRPLATGYNPAFAVKNLPRDITHAYLASDQYSIFAPKFAFQITRDLAGTAKDAWKKDGQFLDYIEEGGGMDFLTHQGRQGIANPRRGIGEDLTKSSPGLRKWKDAAAKINEMSEIWVRLALRRRGLRNGLTSREATYEARRYLDFSQGGMLAKQADHVIPYLNASMQAFRTTARAARERPGRFAGKAANLMGAAGAIQLSGYFTNPEAMRDIPEDVRRRNFVIPLPEMFSYTDPRTGEYKHRYIAIARDNTMNAVLNPLEMAMEKYLYDMDPDQELTGELWETYQSTAPISPTELEIPAANMLQTYRSNWDSYFGEEVWRGQEVSPENEFYELPNKPTPMIWREFGEKFGMSPVRSERAFRKIVPNNPYLDSMFYGLEKGLEGMTLEEKQRTTGQWFTSAPILNKMFKETHPRANQEIAIEKGIQQTGDRRVNLNRQVDEQFFRVKQGDMTRNEFKDWVRNNLEGEDKRTAWNRFELNTWLDKSLREGGEPAGVGGIPGRGEWLAMTRMDGVARAQYFYERWREKDPKQRRRMEDIAKRLSEAGKSFYNQEFHKEFERQKEQRGTDQY